jgi:hypothetical protein
VTLDNVSYHIRIYWNTRGAFWAIDFYDRDLNLIVAGIKLVNYYEFLLLHPDKGLPLGYLIVVDYRNSDATLVYEDFTNGNCDLVYIEAEAA